MKIIRLNSKLQEKSQEHVEVINLKSKEKYEIIFCIKKIKLCNTISLVISLCYDINLIRCYYKINLSLW